MTIYSSNIGLVIFFVLMDHESLPRVIWGNDSLLYMSSYVLRILLLYILNISH
jgi:hypothetical protein